MTAFLVIAAVAYLAGAGSGAFLLVVIGHPPGRPPRAHHRHPFQHFR
jgi:hypothetical protein